MSTAKVIEISSSSTVSFHDAVEKGIAEASKTVHGITGAWVNEEQIVEKDTGREWRVNLKLSFVLRD